MFIVTVCVCVCLWLQLLLASFISKEGEKQHLKMSVGEKHNLNLNCENLNCENIEK